MSAGFKSIAGASVSKSVKVEDDEYDMDIDAFLNGEASELTRENEMRRVLASFKLNPYEVLGIPLSAIYEDPESIMAQVKKLYRSKSLLLHPDKLKHADGPKAFDMLKKAEGELTDEDKRKNLDEVIRDSRMLVLRALNLKPDTEDSHRTLRNLDPPLPEQIRLKAKELLIDEELRKRRKNKVQMIAEGAEEQRKEKERLETKKRKETAQAWEESRETRVSDWRNFQTGGTKRKKFVHKALG